MFYSGDTGKAQNDRGKNGKAEKVAPQLCTLSVTLYQLHYSCVSKAGTVN